MSNIGRAIELPEDDRFSCEPEMLFAQAQRVGKVSFSTQDTRDLDRAGMDAKDDELHLLYFARNTESNGQTDGCELVAYNCDRAGRVLDWSHRYRVCDFNVTVALDKLQFQIVNGCAKPGHIENEVPGQWTIDILSGVLD